MVDLSLIRMLPSVLRRLGDIDYSDVLFHTICNNSVTH